MQSNTLLTGTSSLVFEGGQLSSGIQKGFLSGGVAQIGYTQQGQILEQYRRDHQPSRNGSMSLQFVSPSCRASAGR